MTAHTVFCSARDRNVRLIPLSPDWAGHVLMNAHPKSGVACSDRGRHCTGTLCPFSAEAVAEEEADVASPVALPLPI